MMKILDLIKELFKKIFKKNNVKQLNEGKKEEISINEEVKIDTSLVKVSKKELEKYESDFLFFNDQQEKKDFFLVYDNVKKGILDINDLIITDRINVILMMQKEEEILDEKIKKIKEENIKLIEKKEKLLKRKNALAGVN